MKGKRRNYIHRMPQGHHFIDVASQISGLHIVKSVYQGVKITSRSERHAYLFSLVFLTHQTCLFSVQRDSLSAQLDLTVTKAESEQLARALQEEQYFELSQENKKATSRHKQEVGEKESTVTRVSKSNIFCISLHNTYYLNLLSQSLPEQVIIWTFPCSLRTPIKL